jgi:hypothetical protein
MTADGTGSSFFLPVVVVRGVVLDACSLSDVWYSEYGTVQYSTVQLVALVQ